MKVKVEVHIDPQLTQTQVVIHAPARSPQVEQLVRQLEELTAPSTFTVFRDGEARLFPLSDIFTPTARGCPARPPRGPTQCGNDCMNWRRPWPGPGWCGCPTRRW